MTKATVSEKLVAFAQAWQARGVPQQVHHEAKRLLLNQLKASVGAAQTDTVRILSENCVIPAPGQPMAHMLWLGTRTTPGNAALVNGALFEVLDFHDTYIPCYMHATSAVLPAVLAAAEGGGQSGRQVIEALALGIEVELAVATMLIPTAYFRGYVPAGLAGGVGAAAACALLRGLDADQMRNAIGIAMCSCFGSYVSVGSMTLAYITGQTAQSGLQAAELAARGFDAPATAFEAEKGMFVTHSDEDPAKIEAIMSTLGETWRICGQSYKTIPTETITHGPVELMLTLRDRANGRTVDAIDFRVAPIVTSICDERMQRFGDPSSELTARFDTCFCAAAAWQRGKFTLAEMQAGAFSDPDILALRSRIRLLPDENRQTFEGCSVSVRFSDGAVETANVDAFLGSPNNPMSDHQLSALFRSAAAGFLADQQADAILDAVWSLDQAPDISALVALLRLNRATGETDATR